MIMKYVAGGLGLVSVALTVAFFIQKAQIADLKADKRILESNNLTLTNSLAQSEQTKDTLLELSSKNAEITESTLSRIQEQDNAISGYRNEIDGLRATVEKKALEAPFEAGNTATDRLNRRLCSISGRTDGPCSKPSDSDGADNS